MVSPSSGASGRLSVRYDVPARGSAMSHPATRRAPNRTRIRTQLPSTKFIIFPCRGLRVVRRPCGPDELSAWPLRAGGIIFGWNSLSVVLKDLGEYESGCSDSELDGSSDTSCSSQSSDFAIIYNVGVFAVNFGPALAGPLLDWAGPKLAATMGAALSAFGIIWFGALLTPTGVAIHMTALLTSTS